MQRFYKLVRRSGGGKYHSAFAGGMSDVEYGVGVLATAPEWLREEGYNLTVFDSVTNALKMVAPNKLVEDGYALFSCAVKLPIHTLPTVCSNFGLKKGRFEKLLSSSWPSGTIMVDGVILMNEITSFEADVLRKKELGE